MGYSKDLNDIKCNINDGFIAFGNTVYLFFVLFFPQLIKYSSIAFLIFSVMYCMIKKIRFKFNTSVLLWILYIIFSCIISIFSPYVSMNNLIETVVGFSISLYVCVIEHSSKSCLDQIKGLQILSLVVLIGACLQVVSPEFICNFNRLHFDDYKYNMFYYSFFKGGYLTGFSFQTAITAYYCSIFVAINACYYFTFGSTLKTIKKVLLMCISMLALVVIFFTSKRSFILYSIIIVLFLCYFYYKKHIFKIITYTLIICGSIYYLLINTEAGQRMIERSQGESLTTNRSDLIDRMLSFFSNKPLTGNGLSSTLLLIPDFTNGHNIYVQILCETGLIGFIIIIPFFIKSLFLTFKQLKMSTTNNSKYIYSSCLCVQMLFLMWGFTGNPLYDVYPLFVYMMSVGIVWSMQEYTLKEKEKP